jgi:hypothetical protein
MADRLDAAIAAKQKLVLDLQEQLTQAQAELGILKNVAAQHPVSNGNANWAISGGNGPAAGRPGFQLGGPPPGRKGRQKGSISHKWRETFAAMYNSGHPNSPEEIRRFAQKAGINITLRSARTRALEYVKAGFLDIRDTGFWVREDTIRKFNLKKA